jgi:N6-L-threonylcarbamoyladenine synthase
MIMLGIESSCDETGIGIVTDTREILANRLITQLDEHKLYGGVVPEIAARAHLGHIDTLLDAAMKDAGISYSDLDGVAATCGPGLIGGVMIGMMTGKAIAASQNLPFIAVNHLEAHALTPRMTDDIEFPFLLLLISGMNTQILLVKGVGDYTCLGQTIDDAIGECFDKTGRLLELGYPGGPHIQKLALQCQDVQAARKKYQLPVPLRGRKTMDFSFSGLKTAMRTHIQNDSELDKVALCASFQATVIEILNTRLKYAFTVLKEQYASNMPKSLVISGGVAANTPIREHLASLATENGLDFFAPPLHLCSDNGVMIAWTGIERLKCGYIDALDVPARPRWPLDPQAVRGRNTK